MQKYRNIEGLKINKLFGGVKESIIEEFFKQDNFNIVDEGNVIYQTGDNTKFIYLLLSGDVKIKYSGTYYISNKILNEFFGEKEIFEGTRRKSAAVANSRCLLYRIEKKTFKKLLNQNSTIHANIKKHGELTLPEIKTEPGKVFNIDENSKPVSFKATNNTKQTNTEEVLQDVDEPSEEKPEIVEFVPSTERELEEEPAAEEEKENKKLKEELLDDPDDFKNWQFEEDKEVEEPVNFENSEIIEDEAINDIGIQQDQNEGISVEVEKSKEEDQFDRENLRKVLSCIGKLYSGLTPYEAIKSVIKSLSDLTGSESGELILIDENNSEMVRTVIEGESYSEQHYQLPEGLTGSCALQKKILNFDRPTEDTRFKPTLDQPGSARLKSIIYFPIVNESGETIAVVQLARENKKYTDIEISNLNMLSKHIEGAITRSFKLDELLLNEKERASNNISKLILNEMKIPIHIIYNYVNLLSDKKLPEEIDEVLRMLLKQTHAIEDLSSSIVQSTRKEFELDTMEVHFNEFIDDILEVLSEYCDSREVKLYKKIGDGTIVSLDRAKFFSAVFNIFRQACDGTGKDGSIYFSTELLEELILINIKDESKGTLEDISSDVLELAYSTHKFDNKKIGLRLAKRIIEAHEGQLTYEGDNGNGNTYRISIPVLKKEIRDES